ncbi:hypothetical protein HY772_05395 [Candidatus Woesearchaeota archaeon]|nr:hypothetical protein [Candidatus Woesearchaeota archaeon]
MKSWIYCNALGCFVIDENKKIINSLPFSEEAAVQDPVLPEAGKTLDAQMHLQKKYPSAELIVPSDEGVPLVVLAAFNDKKFLEKLRVIALKRTKQKIAQSVRRDALIVQAINEVDELDTVMNMLVKRLREWYGLHNPEFEHAIDDHQRFVQTIMDDDRTSLLKKIKVDERYAMGAPFAKEDIEALMRCAKKIASLYELRADLISYVENVMEKECPNVLEMCGTSIGAKLLSIAGGLERLSRMPASTIQLLGAEKALFRHLRNRSYLPPKYGVIIQHPLVAKVKKNDKGKAARALADKIAIAAKVDFFKGKKIAPDLKKQLVDRFGEYS